MCNFPQQFRTTFSNISIIFFIIFYSPHLCFIKWYLEQCTPPNEVLPRRVKRNKLLTSNILVSRWNYDHTRKMILRKCGVITGRSLCKAIVGPTWSTRSCLWSFCAGTRNGAQVGPIVAVLTGARPPSYKGSHETSYINCSRIVS